MELQLLHSEIVKTPEILDDARELYNQAAKCLEVKGEEDIDNLSRLISRVSKLTHIKHPVKIDLNRMAAHAKVAKPFITYSAEEDYFI